MKSLLLLRNIRVENANAIAGHTYGFPAVTAFLGFVHALSRQLTRAHKLSLGGCVIICHNHQVHAHQPGGWGDYVFSLTRNPLTKEGNTPAFVEEGRMHMEVSLFIECDFTVEDLGFDTGDEQQEVESFLASVLQKAIVQRLAGGTIVDIGKAAFEELDDDREQRRKQVQKALYRSLPGFALVDRSELLQEHYSQMVSRNPEAELIDAWLDFSALKQKAVPERAEADEQATSDHKATWSYVPKPAAGWLVPLAIGYKAISPLYENDQVARTRDNETPFCFVELAYGLGQWLSPHRIDNIEDLLWRYHADDNWYLCRNIVSNLPLQLL